MVQADLSFKGETHAESGVYDRPADVKSLLNSLTHEIEHARLRQDNALHDLERHIRALEAAQAAGSPLSWDQASADALAALYDHHNGEATPEFAQASVPQAAPDALGEVYQRMGDLEGQITHALQDLYRRQDTEGLRAVEDQVRDVSGQLDEVKGQLARLEAIETMVREIAWQVSDERLISLVKQGGQVAAGIEGEMHGREGQQEELRKFIEATIADWRDTEARAQETSRELNAERYESLAALIETSMAERRASEAQAMVVLDTLQDAMVNVLDRIEALEGGNAPLATVGAAPEMAAVPAPSPVAEVAPVAAPIVHQEFAAPDGWADEPKAEVLEKPAPAAAFPQAPSFSLSVDPLGNARLGTTMRAASPAKAPEAAAEPAEAEAAPQAATPAQPSRRDMLLEVHRAKLKAAGVRSFEEAAETQVKQKPQKQISAGLLPGRSSTLLAAALAIVVAINGGLLFFARSTPPVPSVSIEPMASATSSDASAAMTAAREPDVVPADGAAASPAGANENRTSGSANQFGYGYYGNAIDETQTPVTDISGKPPKGMTVDAPPQTASKEVMAQTYEEQVLAGLSGDVGVAASQATPADLLPEKAGRVDAALTVEEPNRAVAKAEAMPEGAMAAKPQLDMPPITVGPQSLRLAAANGNAAAEFEVATRMAEGKGMPQDPKEAFRWYQRSASRGFAQAQYRVGTFYERGLAVERDLPRAMVWYQRAAEQGNVKAMHNLAVLAAGGINGNPDYKTALTWFTKAANYGLADSQYNVAVLYENGLGPSTDRIVAFKWYTLAAKGGDKDAAERRDALKATLTKNESKSAEGLIASFHAEMPDKLANEPLAAQEAWKKEASNQTE